MEEIKSNDETTTTSLDTNVDNIDDFRVTSWNPYVIVQDSASEANIIYIHNTEEIVTIPTSDAREEP